MSHSSYHTMQSVLNPETFNPKTGCKVASQCDGSGGMFVVLDAPLSRCASDAVAPASQDTTCGTGCIVGAVIGSVAGAALIAVIIVYAIRSNSGKG